MLVSPTITDTSRKLTITLDNSEFSKNNGL